MTRIGGNSKWSCDPNVLIGPYKKHPDCCACNAKATVWIRLNDLNAGEIAAADLFLCDADAFHLARILMQDIGHIKAVIKPASCEPTS